MDIVIDEKKLKKLASQPSFKSFKICNENLVIVERKKIELKLNRPIYVGFSILDVSKVLMYDFHYNYIKAKYPGNKSNLLFTDTDSLMYSIKTINVYSDFYNHKEKFDFSDYDKGSNYYNSENKKKIGKMKDELKGTIVREFVGLRAKMYSVFSDNIVEEKKEMKKAKGVKKSVVKKEITHRNYVDCLINEKTYMHQMTTIKSYQHQLYTVKQNKVSLCPYDDKRYLLEDGITSLPYGHYRIP